MTAMMTATARPFVKWAGGKTRLLPELMARLPAHFEAYHEPFLGGGALFFEVAGEREATFYLSDLNAELIAAYGALRDAAECVIARLNEHRADHGQGHYYAVRALEPETLSPAERAARLIYLNRTCFNGLYRVNRRGRFNVPMGDYDRQTICDEDNLRAVSHLINSRHVIIRASDFQIVLDHAQPGDLVYCDPPYDPLSVTSSFTAYDRSGFTEADQRRLRDVVAELTRRAVYVMLSNSDTPFIRSLYADPRYRIEPVQASRPINRNAHGRGKVGELIIRNY